MLVEFQRPVPVRYNEDEQPVYGNISIDPRAVSAVFESLGSTAVAPVTVVRLHTGRGLLVRGTYAATIEKLNLPEPRINADTGESVDNAEEPSFRVGFDD